MTDFFPAARPFLYLLPPEVTHELGLFALKHRLLPEKKSVFSQLSATVFGLDFPNVLGLAAGFDKNAECLDGLLQQGFGFVEAGTVTPLPQPGNPRPRIFRLAAEEAVINRLGFNNKGLDAFIHNLKNRSVNGIVGANIGKNKDSADANVDYARGLSAVYSYADYITINISSPNTQGLRALQKREALAHLLEHLQEVHAVCKAQSQKNVPLLLKVAPDLDESEKEDIAELAITHGLSGLIISNTTISRPDLKNARANETGGLSGKPLFALSTQTLRDFYRLTRGSLPLIGVGGIASGEDAYAKIKAGASLVQLYTALVYQGFGVVEKIQKRLLQLLEQDGLKHISQAVGVEVS